MLPRTHGLGAWPRCMPWQSKPCAMWGTEPEVCYRDLSSPAKAQGPVQEQKGSRVLQRVVGGWPGKPRCCPWEVAEGATRKSPGATGKSGRPPRGTAGQGESA